MRSGTDFVTGAALSQRKVQISQVAALSCAEAQHFGKVKYRSGGRVDRDRWTGR